jgi:hypothetical protein
MPIIYKKRKVNRESIGDKERVSVSIEEIEESDGSGSSEWDEESQHSGGSEGCGDSERCEECEGCGSSEGDSVSERDDVSDGNEESDRDERDEVVRQSERDEEIPIEGDAPKSTNTEEPDEKQLTDKVDHETDDEDTLEATLGALTIPD